MLITLWPPASSKKGKRQWSTHPPPALQLFLQSLSKPYPSPKLALMGFSRGAYWASHYARHVRLQKLVLEGRDLF
eukprot:11925538-Prorocentrum_lima.AAC.1